MRHGLLTVPADAGADIGGRGHIHRQRSAPGRHGAGAGTARGAGRRGPAWADMRAGGPCCSEPGNTCVDRVLTTASGGSKIVLAGPTQKTLTTNETMWRAQKRCGRPPLLQMNLVNLKIQQHKKNIYQTSPHRCSPTVKSGAGGGHGGRPPAGASSARGGTGRGNAAGPTRVMRTPSSINVVKPIIALRGVRSSAHSASAAQPLR